MDTTKKFAQWLVQQKSEAPGRPIILLHYSVGFPSTVSTPIHRLLSSSDVLVESSVAELTEFQISQYQVGFVCLFVLTFDCSFFFSSMLLFVP
jgi:hypothetical protein